MVDSSQSIFEAKLVERQGSWMRLQRRGVFVPNLRLMNLVGSESSYPSSKYLRCFFVEKIVVLELPLKVETCRSSWYFLVEIMIAQSHRWKVWHLIHYNGFCQGTYRLLKMLWLEWFYMKITFIAAAWTHAPLFRWTCLPHFQAT